MASRRGRGRATPAAKNIIKSRTGKPLPPEKRRREKAKTTAAAERILRKHGFGRKPDKARKKMTMDDAFDANTKRVKSKKTQGVRTQNKMTAAKATAANKRRRGGPSTDR